MSNSQRTGSVVLISFVTALVTAVLTVLAMQRLELSPSDARVAVPDLTGLTQQDALTNLQARGLELQIGGRKAADSTPPDTVLSQSLLPGTKVNRGTTVTVMIAVEGTPKIPDLKGRGAAEASALLEQAGFKIAFGEPVAHDGVAKGQIVSQAPAANTALAAGQTVTVVLSDGPRTEEVPKLVGMSINRAKKVIEQAGFEVGETSWDYDADFGPYAVIGQTPRAGEQVSPGSKIDLVVNQDD